MLRRWLEAQRAEKLYWSTNDAVRAERAKIVERYASFLSEIEVGDDWKILDVGCGPTVVSGMIKGGERYGVDPLMNYFIRDVQNKAMLTSFHFLRGVGELLPFKNGCFDLVVCRNVLDHVQFPEKVLKEIRRVSKSSATLLLGVDVHSGFVFRLKKGVERMGIIGLKEKFHPYFFTEETLSKSCSKYFSTVKKRIVFSDKAKWIKIKFKMPDVQNQRMTTKFFTLAWILTFFSSLIFTFFWNIVRLLNQTKAPYFVSEYIIIARSK